MFLNSMLNCQRFRWTLNRFHSSIADVLSHKTTSGETVTVSGWIKSIRSHKKLSFVDLNDGSCYKNLQLIIQKNVFDSKLLNVGSSVFAKGTISVQPKNNQIELLANEFRVIGNNPLTEGYPFLPRKTYSYEYIRQYPEFRSRTSKFSTIYRIRSTAYKLIHDFFQNEQFLCANMPILTGNDCEGAGETFFVQPKNQALITDMRQSKEQQESEIFFNHDTYLLVSSQLHLESLAHSFKNVYNFGPIFRAENSRSRFHLSEFYMIEAEQSFVTGYQPILTFVEKLVKTITKQLVDLFQTEIESVLLKELSINFCEKVTPLIDHDFLILTHSEAQKIVREKFPKSKQNFTKEQEVFLVKEHGYVPIFITEWPRGSKPFYMKGYEDEGNDRVQAFDLLIPSVGELVGGGLRENNYDRLQKNMSEANVQNLDWYLSLRKFGSVPTAGFGLGFERFLQYLLHLDNIKDTIPFPRWPHSCLI